VGAAPIQNIGAYGVEVGEYIQSIEAYDCHSKTVVNLLASECGFTYRNSIFKAIPIATSLRACIFTCPLRGAPVYAMPIWLLHLQTIMRQQRKK
jgi:UDP-N-acetylmuramate dehydrogenase